MGQTATVAPAATSCWASARAGAFEGRGRPPRGHRVLGRGAPVRLRGCAAATTPHLGCRSSLGGAGGAGERGWRAGRGDRAAARAVCWAGCETRGRRCCKAWRSGDRCPGDPRLSAPSAVHGRPPSPHTPCRICAPQFDGRQPAPADTRPAGGVRHTEPRSGVPLCCEPRPGRLGRLLHRPGSDACSDWRGRCVRSLQTSGPRVVGSPPPLGASWALCSPVQPSRPPLDTRASTCNRRPGRQGQQQRRRRPAARLPPPLEPNGRCAALSSAGAAPQPLQQHAAPHPAPLAPSRPPLLCVPTRLPSATRGGGWTPPSSPQAAAWGRAALASATRCALVPAHAWHARLPDAAQQPRLPGRQPLARSCLSWLVGARLPAC